jgi:CHAD domain-containing protein
MPELKTPTISNRAERALARATKDRNARLAAGVVAGAGTAVAAAKVALDRARQDTDDEQPRTFRLRRKESPIAGIRRVAEGRADEALDQLRDGVERNPEAAVHEARKDLKKLRSVLRLVRHEIGEGVYRRENVRFRDAGRALSGARDAKVKLETLAALRERFDDRFADDELALLAHALEAERERLADPGGDALALDRATGAIEAGREAIADWPLHTDDWALIGPGLRRSSGRGRSRLAEVRSEASDEAVHEWRKRVKDLWYHVRLVRNAKKSVLGDMADQTHHLSDLLGDHHDLAVLREDAIERRELLAAETLETLRASISERQDELAADAIDLGERIYAKKPTAFERRIRAYWKSWR